MKNNKPSIVHIIDSLSVGGAERMLVDIVNAIDPTRYSISVCVTRSASPLAAELGDYIHFTALNRKNKFDLDGFRKLKEFAESHKADIFHAHSRSTLSFLCAAKMLGYIDQHIIIHDHYGNIEFDKKVPSWFRFYGAKQLAHYIGVYKSLTDWARSAGVAEGKLTVIENAVSLNRFDRVPGVDIRSRLGIPENKKICVIVGNIRYAKGLDLLIGACAQIARVDLPAIVVIGLDVEPDYIAECKKKIHSKGLDTVFHFVGPQENALGWMKGADMGAIPSRSESGPLVLIELMACGLPFVAFNVGSIGKSISQVFPDSFAPPKDVNRFASRFSALIESENWDSSEMKKMARELFDIRDRVSSIEEIYDSILQGGR